MAIGVIFLWRASLAFIATHTAYVFPDNMPVGCSASGANYTCGALMLDSGDTLDFNPPVPAALQVNGDFQVNGAQVNASGTAVNLNLMVTGVLSVDTGGTVMAGLSAGSVTNVAGNALFGGAITTSTGDIQLGNNTTVTGNVTSSSGVITLGNYGDVRGNLSTSAAITVGDFAQVSGSVTGTAGGAITVGANAKVTGPVHTGGAITVGANATVGEVTSTNGAVTVGASATVSGVVKSGGAITVGASAIINGSLTGVSGAITVGANAAVAGAVYTAGAVTVGANATVNSSVTSTAGAITLGAGSAIRSVCCGTSPCNSACVTNNSGAAMPPMSDAISGPHHLELHHGTGSGLTCRPSTLTVVACADTACSSLYTDGVAGTLSVNGVGMTVNWPDSASFSIPSGSASVTKSVQITTAGSVVLGVSNASPGPANASLCNFGNPSCTFTAADAGFVFTVPNQLSAVPQQVSIAAVRRSDTAALCVPAFASVSKSLTLRCAYLNPGSGTMAVRVGGVALNAANVAASACDGGGRAVNLAFNSAGVATTTVQYDDAGQVQVNALYTGTSANTPSDAGLVMNGASTFVAAPASFGFSALPAGPLQAGIAFSATVTALNVNGAPTPNFGQETLPQSVSVAFTRAQPTGSGASDGTFSGNLGAFTAGAARAANLVWSEVGRGDLSATLTGANYLGSGLGASGTTANAGSAGAIGRFTPHHFVVAVTPACASFSYAGQPFAVQITAKNGLSPPDTTVNYDASTATAPNLSQKVTLSDIPSLVGLGSFTGTGVAASLFRAGEASTPAPTYSFITKLTPEKLLTVRAIDADGVSSSGYTEGSTLLRSGRLKLSNAFGSEKSPLLLAVQAQYWSGNAWVLNSADSCSVMPAAAVVLGGYLDNKGAPSSAATAWSTTADAFTLSNGAAALRLSAPNPTLTGSVDLALNLGLTATDASCLTTHPPGTGAALAWLRSQNGGCSTAWDRDPSARATFGIYSPESRRLIHSREIY